MSIHMMTMMMVEAGEVVSDTGGQPVLEENKG
jgi:hypothetical protein